MKSISFVAASVFLLMLSSCAPTHSLKWDWRQGHQGYHQIAMEEVKSTGHVLLSTTPRDYQRYCPDYPKLNQEQRALFWASLVSCIARHESSHKAESAYQEDILNRAGDKVTSRGLLQCPSRVLNTTTLL